MIDILEDINNCLETLKSGGIILYPTDTIWGLGCDATNEKAVERIYMLKQRPANKNMILLVADEREVLQYASQPDLRVFDYLKTVQRPTTVIYEGAIGIASNVTAPDGSVGIRIVSEPFCKHLVKRFRKPIVSTSANISGEPSPRFFREISSQVKKGADYIVRHRQDDETVTASSSVIKWNLDGSVTTLR